MVKNLQRDANGHTDYNVIGKWYTSLQMDEEDVIWSLDHVWPAAASAGPAAPGGSQGSLPDKDETTSGVATLTSTASSNLFADLDEETSGKISQDFFQFDQRLINSRKLVKWSKFSSWLKKILHLYCLEMIPTIKSC